MRKTLIVGVTLALMCGSALAQTQAPPAQQGPGNRAVNTEGTNNSSAPVAGANSFTEGQAKSRIEAGGYSNVTELKKDDSGVLARQRDEGRQVRDGQRGFPRKCHRPLGPILRGHCLVTTHRRNKSYDYHYYSTLR